MFKYFFFVAIILGMHVKENILTPDPKTLSGYTLIDGWLYLMTRAIYRESADKICFLNANFRFIKRVSRMWI
jgi:hypothetical protein